MADPHHDDPAGPERICASREETREVFEGLARDLPRERYYVQPLPPDQPTEHMPGSAEKVEVMRARRAARRLIHHERDPDMQWVDRRGFIVRRLLNGATIIVGVAWQQFEEEPCEAERPGVLLTYTRRGATMQLVRQEDGRLVVEPLPAKPQRRGEVGETLAPPPGQGTPGPGPANAG